MTSILREDQYKVLIISRSVLLIVRNVSDNSCRGNQNTHFVLSKYIYIFFFFENRAVYEIKWKNIVQPARPQMTTWLTRNECWITKATDTHVQVV